MPRLMTRSTLAPAGRTRPLPLLWETTLPRACSRECRSVRWPTPQCADRSLRAALEAVRSITRGTMQRTVETGTVGVGMDGVVGAVGVVGIGAGGAGGAGGVAGETR